MPILDPAEYPVETANACLVEGRFNHLAGRHRAAIELLKRAVELLTPRASRGPGDDAAETALDSRLADISPARTSTSG